MSEPRSAVLLGEDGVSRCAWSASDAEYRRYHDEEWGVELRGDRPLFEKVSLEGFQAGLSWITILRRRQTFRAAFRDFDIDGVAEFTEQDVERLMLDPGIIRNRAKIEATISNAVVVRQLAQDDPGAFDRLLWGFAPAPGLRSRPASFGDIPAVTAESTAMSKGLRAIGLRFVGPTTMYALMQSSGMVDDHVEGCWRAV
ncbi:DNA-3-methyladenine glycosylase I [Glaciihabitans sp. INWT7]|uniref:DNA-3-methyladenine glycosylase I n=1 Tax=Glaciihabitans sp. INWT7 TaxID=2596912 RepID=UPI001628D0A7|nr:DNA-3-methyladenine glycosylase I [Glaciihabitans sp. INWT7]QNE46431.1 DNA-3-methyladenine glycosylase I [Glaciihabitans sp. INWT7]